MYTDLEYIVPSSSEGTLGVHTLIQIDVLGPAILAGTRACSPGQNLSLQPFIDAWASAPRMGSVVEPFDTPRWQSSYKHK